jgi:AraC family transcriptional regulator, exoenzyme S synthesis regulatory protein ExsA
MNAAATRMPEYVIGEISPEQFIADHSFIYIIKGIMRCYDGSKTYVFRSGDYGLARKNRLGRYKKEKEDGELEKVFVFFDEQFLRLFQQKHASKLSEFKSTDTMVPIERNELIPNFIQSLLPYYGGGGRIDPAFADIKKEELLVILLRHQPELSGVFFDFGVPQKINLEEFMNRNFKFNVSLQRFAYLTGRSLSAFKRDFKAIFRETPNRWLVRKRLQEAYFLIEKSKKKPSDIYLDLGFEDLSHFSFAFKKLFGLAPTDLAGAKNGSAG